MGLMSNAITDILIQSFGPKDKRNQNMHGEVEKIIQKENLSPGSFKEKSSNQTKDLQRRSQRVPKKRIIND